MVYSVKLKLEYAILGDILSRAMDVCGAMRWMERWMETWQTLWTPQVCRRLSHLLTRQSLPKKISGVCEHVERMDTKDKSGIPSSDDTVGSRDIPMRLSKV
jgi:hypothetical protein